MHPAMMIATSVYLPDVKDYRMLTWHGIPPLGWCEYSITIIMREVFAIVLQLCSDGREVPPFDISYFLPNSVECAGKLKGREAMFSLPKGPEKPPNTVCTWGIKRGLADHSNDPASSCEMTKTFHTDCVSPAVSSASCRNNNGTSTLPSASLTVKTSNVSSPEGMSCSASGAQKPTTSTSQDSVTSSQENKSERCSPVGKTSTSSDHTNPHPCVGKPDYSQDEFSLQQPNAAPTEKNSEQEVASSDQLKGVTHSRLFHAMWSNLAPEECQLKIPGAEMCSLSKYLEEKPLECVTPPKGTVLLVDGKNYDARQVLSQFRRGVVYVKMSKKMFTEENFYQNYPSARVLPDQIPFQVTQAGVSKVAGMLHRDFCDKRFQGVRGRPQKGIWPLDKEPCGKMKTSMKRSAPTTRGRPTNSKEVKAVPEKCRRSSENELSTGMSGNVESKQLNNQSTLEQDSNPSEALQMASGSTKNDIFAQLVAALTGIPLKLENHEDSKKGMTMVTSLRQTADFLYQTAAEIEKKL